MVMRVELGPFATFPLHPPEADVPADIVLRRFVPFATKVQRSKARLFDHFSCANLQALRDRQANTVCGALVDDKFETGGLLHRQVTRWRSMQEFCRASSQLSIDIVDVRPIGQVKTVLETSGFDSLIKLYDTEKDAIAAFLV
jgi:hypothetical protein